MPSLKIQEDERVISGNHDRQQYGVKTYNFYKSKRSLYQSYCFFNFFPD